MNPAPFPTEPTLGAAADPDEAARAELYGLLARLWFAPPDAALLARLRAAPGASGTPDAAPGGAADAPAPDLAGPWQRLLAQARAATPASAAAEYDALFQGVGKAEVLLFGSYYRSGFLHERPLAALRADLAALGLTRDAQRGETEDHIAYGFEVMRYLIAGDDPAHCDLAQQQRFFRTHLQPWVARLCDAVQAHPRAALWAAMAELTRAFVEIETQAFDMLDA